MVPIRVGTVFGLFQRGRVFVRVKFREGHGRTHPSVSLRGSDEKIFFSGSSE